jgi:hypothetical protein
MPRSIKYTESDLLKACEAIQAQKKPNFTKIAREYGVPLTTLRGRVKNNRQPRTACQPVNKVLKEYQEEALIQCIAFMRDHYMPVTPKLVEEYANRSLQRAGKSRRVSKMWIYRFEKWLPEHLNLGPAKQKTKESKCIKAEDAGLLANWYNQLSRVVKKDTPARLVYNFDEAGFQPGEGKSRTVISTKVTTKAVPDLPEAERGENITTIECIAADGWQMDPWFIFKGIFLPILLKELSTSSHPF